MFSYTKELNGGNDRAKLSSDEIELNYNIKDKDNWRTLWIKDGSIRVFAAGNTFEDADKNLKQYFELVAEELAMKGIQVISVPQKNGPTILHNTSVARYDFKVDCDPLKEFYQMFRYGSQYKRPINTKKTENPKDKITPFLISSIYNLKDLQKICQNEMYHAI